MPHQLTSQQSALVDRIAGDGSYPDAGAVIDEALRLLDERDRRQRLQWLRGELRPALEQEARGELIDVTPGYVEDVQRRAAEAAHAGKPIRDAVRP